MQFFDQEKGLFGTGSVAYIAAVVNLRLNETYLPKISLHFLLNSFQQIS